LPLAAAVLAAAAIVVTVSGPDRPAKPEVVAADEVGATYFSDVATFKARVMRALNRNRGAHASKLRDIVDRHMQSKPTLAPPPPGADKSRTYQEAVKAQPTIFAPVTRLRERLDAAARAEAFVLGADDALDRAAVGDEQGARNAFRRLAVPPDARPAARRVDAALTDKPSFSRHEAARKALHDYAVVTDGNLAEAVARMRDDS
jgi:hypothetical protein